MSSSVRASRTAMLRAAFTGTRPNTCEGVQRMLGVQCWDCGVLCLH